MFYRKCFTGNSREDKLWFDSELMDLYLKRAHEEELIEQLEYLRSHPFPASELMPFAEKIVFLHGKNDAVIPASEGRDLFLNMPRSSFKEVNDTGHCGFFHPEFKEAMEQYA